MSADPLPSIRIAVPDDDRALVALWQTCGLTRPWNDPIRDLARARHSPDARVFCIDAPVDENDSACVPIASVMVGYDGHRGWLYYLSVAPASRGQGLGRALIARARTHLLALGCPKMMLMRRDGQPGLAEYYDRQGLAEEPAKVHGIRLIRDTSD